MLHEKCTYFTYLYPMKKHNPYFLSLLTFCFIVTLAACKKQETKPDTTQNTGNPTTPTTPNPSPVDTSAPLDPNPINNTTGNYLGSLHVYKFIRSMSGKMLDSSDVTYDSQLKITNPESNKLLWETDGSIFFAMAFNGYSTNFADDEEHRKYVVFHAKERYVDYFDRTIIKDKDKGTITTSGTEGTWYKQSN